MRYYVAGLAMSALLLIAACCGIPGFSVQKFSGSHVGIAYHVEQKAEQKGGQKEAVAQEEISSLQDHSKTTAVFVANAFFIQSALTSQLINTI